MSERVLPNVILRAEVGSRAWGLNLSDSGDRDEMGIVIEEFEHANGLGSQFENYVYRSAEERDGKDAPSQVGDLDLTLYSLRKWLRLALKGNPTILTLLFIPSTEWVDGDARGGQLQELAPKIVSRQAGKAFLGYLEAQRMRFLGERGGRHGRWEGDDPARDYKYAMHMLRLGFQGCELLKTGRLQAPLEESVRTFLLGVRKGEVESQNILTTVGGLERELRDLICSSPLQEKPDEEFVENWMLNMYWENWKAEMGNPVSLPGWVRKWPKEGDF